jgi:DNA-binding GntR family transcriptional regulator
MATGRKATQAETAGDADTVPRSRAIMVYRALRRAIIEQALAPGAKLPEDAIGERLGVSRTLVREALAKLAGEGLVELRHNRSASVAYPSLEEAREVFAVRRAMERLVVEELAGRLTAEQRRRLAAHVDREDAARERGGAESIRLAGEFHLLLAECTGNGLLIRYVNEVASRCSLILAIYGRPHSSDCAVSEHRDLIAALENGDVPAAVRVMDHHLSAVMGRALLSNRQADDVRDVLVAFAREEGLGAQAPAARRGPRNPR